MPGGGYISIAVSYEMYRSWGFSSTDVGLSVAVTSVLNIFAKLALPAIALVLIILSGRARIARRCVGGRRARSAERSCCSVSSCGGSASRVRSGPGSAAATWMSRRFRRSRTFDWGDAAVRFRRHDDFLVERWFWLTSTTIVSHLSLYLVLLALRFVGVANDEITWAQVLGVFAFGRLLTAVPIRQAGRHRRGRLHRGLILAGEGHATVPPTSSTRSGGGRAGVPSAHVRDMIRSARWTYLIWRTNTSWRRPRRSFCWSRTGR